MDMFYVLLFFNLLNAYVIFDFMDRMYGRTYTRRRVYFFAYIVFVAVHLFVNSFRIPEVNMIYEIFNLHLFSCTFYQYSANKFIYNLLFASYLIFIDEGSFSIYSVLKTQSLFFSFSNSEDMLITGIIGFAIVFSTYYLIIYVFKHYSINKVSIRQYIFFISLIVLELLIIQYFTKSKIEEFGTVLTFFIVSFLCLDLYIVYLFNFVAKHNDMKNQINLSKQQSIMLNRNIHDIENKYKQSRKVIHDVRNYLQILQELYQQGEEVEAAEYADQLNEKLNELEYRFQCDNRILTIIINDQLLTAKAKGIEMRLQIENLEWDFMQEIDLTTLFANLLNNAIEACEGISGADKFVDVRIGAIQSHMVIRIDNSYRSESLLQNGDKFMTTKAGHSGIGISNIRAVTQKYDGNLKIETAAGVFTVKIILPNSKI